MMDEIRSVGKQTCRSSPLCIKYVEDMPVLRAPCGEELEMPHELLCVVSCVQLQGMRPRRCSELPAAERCPPVRFRPSQAPGDWDHAGRGFARAWSTRSRRSWSFDEHMQPRHLTVRKTGGRRIRGGNTAPAPAQHTPTFLFTTDVGIHMRHVCQPSSQPSPHLLHCPTSPRPSPSIAPTRSLDDNASS